MTIGAVTISIVALVVSVLSLLLSFYQATVNRRLQWEQLRGSFQVRLTSQGVELVNMMEQLPCVPGHESCDIKETLLRIAEGLVDLRRRIAGLTPPWFLASFLIIGVTSIKCDLDDGEPVFDALKAAMSKGDVPRASRLADGLLERLYGVGKKNPETDKWA